MAMNTITITNMITGMITGMIRDTGTRTTMDMGIRMAREAGSMAELHPELALAAFFSPAFPTGGFAYSGGLETAVAEGTVKREADLERWLAALMRCGSMRNDCVLFAQAWRSAGNEEGLAELAELAAALCGSMERQAEAVNQGSAFGRSAGAWTGDTEPPSGAPYAIAAGASCALAGIALPDALKFFLQSLVSGQLQAAIRLSVTGQNGALRLLAAMAPSIAAAAESAEGSGIADLGSGAFLADIASLGHETLSTRLFLS
jgi:urease accessory protein